MNMYMKYTNMILNSPINRSTLEFGRVMVHGKPKWLCYQTVSYCNMRRIWWVVSCWMHTLTYFAYTLQHRNGAFITHFCIAIIYFYASFKVPLKIYIYAAMIKPMMSIILYFWLHSFNNTGRNFAHLFCFFSISTRWNLYGNMWIV